MTNEEKAKKIISVCGGLIEKSNTELKEQILDILNDEPKIKVPKVRDGYWYINDVGQKGRSSWCDDSFDNFRLKNRNVFLTEEACDKEVARRKVICDIKNYAEDKWGVFVPDWGDESQTKYFIISEQEIGRRWIGDFFPIFGYFAKKEHVQEIIEKFREELKLFEA